ncbi:AAA domain-containing protein [Streptomyces sp. NPDC091204]|uniref:AAA domain-containing protein n=1 Tax=Streptomyces sp. NPDC091204 TaxID=3155299 RepID=UPI003447E30A
MTDTERPYPVAEFLTAVRAEILAEHRNDAEGAVKVELSKGRLLSYSEGAREYLFECRNWHDSLDGVPVLARPSSSRKAWAPAEASRAPDGTVRLVTKADFGAAPTNIQIRKDDSSNWAALSEGLEAVGQQDSPIDAGHAGWLVGRGTPRTGRAENPGQWVADWAGLQLNPRQRDAVAQALASELLFLWGPPGTGKTDVVGHIVEGSFRQGLKILFLAPTNVAVDQALERMCSLLEHEEGFAEGIVQRAGNIVLPSLRSRYGDQVDPGRIAALLVESIDRQISTAADQLKGARAALALHDRVRDLESDLATAVGETAAAGRDQAAAARTVLAADAEAAQLRLAIDKVGAPAGFLAERKAAKLRDLHSALADEAFRAAQAREVVASAARRHTAGGQQAAEARRALPAAYAAVVGIPPRETVAENAASLQVRLDELDRKRKRIHDEVRSRCRVLGATVAKAVQSRKLLDEIDVVVIDEAGMVNLPSAWFAAGLARKRVIVAGDFRQLPAVTKGDGDRQASEEERAHSREWTARDAFHAAGLVDPSGRVRQDPRLVALDTQYRMREPICAVVNEVAYPDAPLKTGRGNTSRLPFAPLIDSPVILIDTSGRRIPGGGRKPHMTNAVHAAVIHELVRGLQYEGVLPGRKWQDVPEGERATDRLAVISPYREQVKALKTSLTHRFGEDYDGLVDTVHRFQGSQRPVVLLDTVAGAGKDPGFFYSGTGLSSQTCRLLNVALSRAQDHLVVVADVAFLRKHLAPHSEALAMVDHLEAHAQTISADQLIPILDADQLANLSEEELVRPAFFEHSEVEAAVEWDVERAQRSIELYSAFMDRAPVGRWARLIGPRTAAGIQVTVFTRPPEEQQEPSRVARHRELVQQLEAAGCRVEFRDRMHEKVLILDGAVLWHGSKNLLANIGPTDLMMRYTDPASCARVRKLMEQTRMERPARAPWRPAEQAAPALPEVPAQRAQTPDKVYPGLVRDGRLYLKVPYEQKDEAKRLLSAKWDKQAGHWWVDATKITREQAARWLP